jgi:DNA-binding transcriptional MocR family regulator
MPAAQVERVATMARSQGVITTPMSAMVVDERVISGMRLSIGAPDRIEDLEWALRVIAQAIAADHRPLESFM